MIDLGEQAGDRGRRSDGEREGGKEEENTGGRCTVVDRGSNGRGARSMAKARDASRRAELNRETTASSALRDADTEAEEGGGMKKKHTGSKIDIR